MAKRYSRELYQNNTAYTVRKFQSRNDWLIGRTAGIGGSDASAVLGENPWKSNLDLWEQKAFGRSAGDISSNERVQYGNDCEDPLRRIYQAKRKNMEVNYQPDTILISNEHPEMLYSPDGLLKEIGTGRNGILEIKTGSILRTLDREKWRDQIPMNYYIQVLHGLNVTGFDFIELIAELTYNENSSQVRIYHIEREEVQEDLQMIQEEILEFWNAYVIPKREPPLKLPRL